MKYKLNTICKTIPADLQTPVGIYLKIRDMYPQSALLESSDFHTNRDSYSFIGIDPIARFCVCCEEIRFMYPGMEEEMEKINEQTDLIKKLREYISGFEFVPNPTGINGFLGYTAYDAIRYFETMPLQAKEAEFAGLPDMLYILYRFTLVVDHFKNQMTVIENRQGEEVSRMEDLISLIHNNNIARYGFRLSGEVTSTVTDEQYKKMVREGVRHIRRGDVFQLVLSRRFGQGFQGDDFSVYRALRCVNPSPYLFYFDFGNFRIFGSSPETHLRVKDGKAYIDPIAGTFKRTGEDVRDSILARQLLADEKENAEHVMLVDLARNDLSRGGEEVHIDFFKQIQYYSHVIHMVSRVSARVGPETDRLRLFANTFPAGTLSGAPKIRAMQLIDELESHARGVYGGCIGYIGLDGTLNQAITIRTFLSSGNRLYFQAGAGIVAHSVPEKELQEVNNKLGALRKALEYAEKIDK